MNELKLRFEDYIQHTGISMTKASSGIGMSVSVISQWLKGDYKGNVEGVEEKVSAWLDLQLSRQVTPEIPFVDLPRTKQIKNAIRTAHEEKFIAMILGNSGSGKSRALQEYNAKNKFNSILLKCDPTFQLSTVVVLLAQLLNVDSKGRIAEVSTRIINELLRRDIVVIADEADYLTDSIFEYLRIAVNDKGRSGLVFVGLPRIEHRIKNLRNDHRQLENRVGTLLHVQEVNDKDIVSVIGAVWSNLDSKVLTAYCKAAKKSLHSLIRLITLSRRIIKVNKKSIPTVECVTDAAAYLMV